MQRHSKTLLLHKAKNSCMTSVHRREIGTKVCGQLPLLLLTSAIKISLTTSVPTSSY